MQLSFDEATPLDSGSGVAATLWFTLDPSATEQTIILKDTLFADILPTTIKRSAAAGGNTLTPIVNEGSIEVRITTDIQDITGDDLPGTFELGQNYPNPFNPTTHIQFSLPHASHVRLEVYNILGRQVRLLIDQSLSAGAHEVTFDGNSESGNQLATGIYFYRLQAENFVETRKMMLIK